MIVQLADKKIGSGQPCFITFEAGPTHDGLESAKRLVKYAADAGADAVKFQIFDPDRLVADKNQMFSYGVLKEPGSGEVETVEEPLFDILQRRSMTAGEWRQVKAYSDELGIAFFSTVAFQDDIDLLMDIGCHSIKIASADVNHIPLLRSAAKTGVCIQLDTGMSTIGEIEAAVDTIRSEGNDNIIIHQCPSGYPARLESINLNIIRTLHTLFPYPVAFSDHTPGSEMDIAAVALGANLVEKTITEDRATRSVEHIMSLEPHEMRDFVQTIRDVEVALGSSRRILHPEERKNRLATRRSAFLQQAARKGQPLSQCAIEFRRPGYGLAPDLFEQIQSSMIKQDLPAGHMLTLQDLDG